MQPCCSKNLNSNSDRERRSKNLMTTLGFSFNNPQWLEQALIHSSYANEHPELRLPSNERLEFLGDAVLQLIISERLFQRYPDWAEGTLSRARASLVRERSLAKAARSIGLGAFLQLGCGEIRKDGEITESVLADALEALIGALYLDAGLHFTTTWIEQVFAEAMDQVGVGVKNEDYKTQLQEMLQQQGPRDIRYILVSESGPAHARHFTSAVSIDGKILGQGSGKNKKRAEQQAAQAAIEALSESD